MCVYGVVNVQLLSAILYLSTFQQRNCSCNKYYFEFHEKLIVNENDRLVYKCICYVPAVLVVTLTDVCYPIELKLLKGKLTKSPVYQQ